MNSKRRPIFLMELGDNTICFLSDLDLPMLSNVVYGFDIQNASSKVTLLGKIEAKGMYEHQFQYRVKLINSVKGYQLYNTNMLKKMLLHLDYFMTSKHKQRFKMHRNNMNVFILL
ncbi:hypothetical protein ACP8HI_18165 [Paenibacillus sp. FA6]|uniref:hypothetical protein n=1 Tax=Paenibacillus sp. FA6 TaxID=3413029 RepID=UPI003F657246